MQQVSNSDFLNSAQRMHLFIYLFAVLCIDSDYFPILHSVISFCNRDGVCLLRGTNRIFYVIQINLPLFKDLKLHVSPILEISVLYSDLKTAYHKPNQGFIWFSLLFQRYAVLVS
jgi:hypothetical protein